jgi:hypothetical protein
MEARTVLAAAPVSTSTRWLGERPATLAARIASMRLRSSRGRFLVALSLIAHCDSEARGRSR